MRYPASTQVVPATLRVGAVAPKVAGRFAPVMTVASAAEAAMVARRRFAGRCVGFLDAVVVMFFFRSCRLV